MVPITKTTLKAALVARSQMPGSTIHNPEKIGTNLDVNIKQREEHYRNLSRANTGHFKTKNTVFFFCGGPRVQGLAPVVFDII